MLTAVNVAIPEILRPLGHVGESISSYLLPQTLDSLAASGKMDLLSRFQYLPCTDVGMRHAIVGHHYKVVQWLIVEKNMEIDEDDAEEVLYKAAMRGYCDLVKLVFGKCDPYDIGNSMIEAAKRNKWSIVKILYETSEPHNIATALELAAIGGRCDVVELLYPAVNDPCYQFAALRAATTYGQCAVVKLLMDQSTKKDLDVMLTEAVRNYQFDIAVLLSASCSRRTVGMMLRHAARNDQCNFVQLLAPKSHFTDVAVALAFAKRGGYAEAVAILGEFATIV